MELRMNVPLESDSDNSHPETMPVEIDSHSKRVTFIVDRRKLSISLKEWNKMVDVVAVTMKPYYSSKGE